MQNAEYDDGSARLGLAPPGGVNRRNRDSRQFVPLLHQQPQPLLFNEMGLDKQFHPIEGLVGFFEDNAEFGDKLGARPRAGRRAPVRLRSSQRPPRRAANTLSFAVWPFNPPFDHAQSPEALEGQSEIRNPQSKHSALGQV